MRRLPPSFDASVSAFREMTATPAEGRRHARARAGPRRPRRAPAQRVATGCGAPAIPLVILSSGAALTAAGFRWRAPAPAAIADAAPGPRPAAATVEDHRHGLFPRRRGGAPRPPAPSDDGERLAYERAHRDAFLRDAPVRALAAWDDYLAGYPRGTFAPEARYNRALCLVRLRAAPAAAEALALRSRGPARRLPPARGLPAAPLAVGAGRARRCRTALRRRRTEVRAARRPVLTSAAMRAALFRRHGGPEVMEVGDVPTPTPGPGEVQVRVTPPR